MIAHLKPDFPSVKPLLHFKETSIKVTTSDLLSSLPYKNAQTAKCGHKFN